MTEKGGNASIVVLSLVLAIVAIGIGAYSLYQAPTAQQSKVQKFAVIMGEGEIIADDPTTGEEILTGEYHRWEPSVIVANKGDTVELTIINPRKNAHSFELPDFGITTGRIAGKTELPDVEGRTIVKTFVADKAGVFKFVCGISPDASAGNCDPDHETMVGYLVVLA